MISIQAKDGRTALYGFLCGSLLYAMLDHWIFIGLHQILFLGISGYLLSTRDYGIWWRAFLLGSTSSLGLLLVLRYPSLKSFGLYVMILSGFHFSEYLVTSLTNPMNLSTDSFLLNHSKEYGIAAIASWLEFFVELYISPIWKSWLYSGCTLGLALCLVGEVLRKCSMIHAGTNFNHIVQCNKSQDHRLVTDGIFSLCRHPSYVGWFLWSIGTQVVLGNPICLISYAIVSWNFFNERIYVEEYNLLRFFGKDYLDYQSKVPVGIPGVKGYVVFDKNL